MDCRLALANGSMVGGVGVWHDGDAVAAVAQQAVFAVLEAFAVLEVLPLAYLGARSRVGPT